MASTLVSMYSAAAIVSAVRALFCALASIQRAASSTALIAARALFGCWSTKSALQPSTFSGWSCQISCEVTAETPTPSIDRALVPRLADAEAVDLCPRARSPPSAAAAR